MYNIGEMYKRDFPNVSGSSANSGAQRDGEASSMNGAGKANPQTIPNMDVVEPTPDSSLTNNSIRDNALKSQPSEIKNP